MNTSCLLKKTSLSISDSEMTTPALLIRVALEGTQSAVSVDNGSTVTMSCTPIAETGMSDAIFATVETKVGNSSILLTTTCWKYISEKTTFYARTANV